MMRHTRPLRREKALRPLSPIVSSPNYGRRHRCVLRAKSKPPEDGELLMLGIESNFPQSGSMLGAHRMDPLFGIELRGDLSRPDKVAEKHRQVGRSPVGPRGGSARFGFMCREQTALLMGILTGPAHGKYRRQEGGNPSVNARIESAPIF